MGELILDPNGAYLLFRSANLLQISTVLVPTPPCLTDLPIQAATWTAELCTYEPTLVPQSRADTPSTSNRRYHITSHATALRADQPHRARAVLASIAAFRSLTYLLT